METQSGTKGIQQIPANTRQARDFIPGGAKILDCNRRTSFQHLSHRSQDDVVAVPRWSAGKKQTQWAERKFISCGKAVLPLGIG
jgi:hypothetical protein